MRSQFDFNSVRAWTESVLYNYFTIFINEIQYIFNVWQKENLGKMKNEGMNKDKVYYLSE